MTQKNKIKLPHAKDKLLHPICMHVSQKHLDFFDDVTGFMLLTPGRILDVAAKTTETTHLSKQTQAPYPFLISPKITPEGKRALNSLAKKLECSQAEAARRLFEYLESLWEIEKESLQNVDLPWHRTFGTDKMKTFAQKLSC